MVAAVHVDELPRRGGPPVREEAYHRPAYRLGVAGVPAQRGLPVPLTLYALEAADTLGGQGPYRTGGDEVDPDARGSEVAGEDVYYKRRRKEWMSKDDPP